MVRTVESAAALQYTPAMITEGVLLGWLLWFVPFMVMAAVIVRILIRPNREPASRVAWIAVVATVPIVGVIAYLLLGETNIGRRNYKLMREAFEQLPSEASRFDDPMFERAGGIPDHYEHLFNVGRSISGFEPLAGNSALLMQDSTAAIDSMIADIKAAQIKVCVLFYIWLDDDTGRRMADALIDAAQRGVRTQAMVDGLGSRAFIKCSTWKEMNAGGVETAIALRLSNPLIGPLQSRMDLRNHRKIVIVDGAITYCGSQNCADAAFAPKAKFGPWVDLVLRCQGPVAQQNQLLFDTDWWTYTHRKPQPVAGANLQANGSTVAQVIASGPNMRNSAMPDLFETLLFNAQRELVISTPYYVPDESMQSALCAAAWRGVDTILLLPERNDSRIVAAASRSYYSDLLNAGVKIMEYRGGLLHSKTLTLDGQVSLVGSANMDRRSFDLNFESNILLYDPAVTAEIRERQQHYMELSQTITSDGVAQWPLRRQLWNNAVAMLGPVI